VEIEARSIVQEITPDQQKSFVDVLARQLSAPQSFAPVVRRSKAVPFGKRSTSDDDYEGPIDLEQDEFSRRPTRVRRQQPSPITQPPTTAPGQRLWQNGDIGTVQALYSDGTFKNIMVGNVVYATEGSEDGSATNVVPLQAQIVTPDGGAIVAGTLFALEDYLAAYQTAGQAKPYIGVSPSQNPGVPYWAGPVTTVANIWSIDITSGELSATYQDSVLQWATNENTVPPAGSMYSGNGDTDAWPASGTIDSQHQAMTLRLVHI